MFASVLRPGISADPAKRVDMSNPSLCDIKVVTSMFAGYHAIKCTPSAKSISVQSCTDRCALRSTTISFMECLPMPAWDSGNFSPAFWDSNPIAFHLFRAFAGFPGEEPWCSAARSPWNSYAKALSPRPERFPPSPSLQATLHESLMVNAVRVDPSDTLRVRIRDLFLPYGTQVSNLVPFDESAVVQA